MSGYPRPSPALAHVWSLLYSVILPPPFQKRRLLVSFYFLPFTMTSGTSFVLRQQSFSSDSFCCFKGIILILCHLIPCLWFRWTPLQLLSPSAVIKACSFFQSLEECVFLQALVGGCFSFLFEKKAELSCLARS